MSLDEVGPSVLVRTSERYVTNTTVVRLGGGRCLVVDPAVLPADLDALADDLEAASLEVVAGWSTHPHWDHVLWSSRLGALVGRHATPEAAAVCRERRTELLADIEAGAPGHELGLCGRLEPGLPRELAASCRLVAHLAHAPGHGSLFFPRLGLLVAGDMVSEIEIPLLDAESADPVGEYLAGLELLEQLVPAVEVFVPGHGAVGDRRQLAGRVAADRRYLSALAAGEQPDDRRLETAWLAAEHERHLALLQGR